MRKFSHGVDALRHESKSGVIHHRQPPWWTRPTTGSRDVCGPISRRKQVVGILAVAIGEKIALDHSPSRNCDPRESWTIIVLP